MIVHPGDRLCLAAAGQLDAADDIQLPQFHRHFPLPPLIVPPAAPA
jgi:hypothetical protein